MRAKTREMEEPAAIPPSSPSPYRYPSPPTSPTPTTTCVASKVLIKVNFVALYFVTFQMHLIRYVIMVSFLNDKLMIYLANFYNGLKYILSIISKKVMHKDLLSSKCDLSAGVPQVFLRTFTFFLNSCQWCWWKKEDYLLTTVLFSNLHIMS